MDYKKIDAETMAISRNTKNIEAPTENIYESVAAMSIRAEQISNDLKAEFEEKISEFQSVTDSLEEIYENREQIEVARYYESLPKPSLMATWKSLTMLYIFATPLRKTPRITSNELTRETYFTGYFCRHCSLQNTIFGSLAQKSRS